MHLMAASDIVARKYLGIWWVSLLLYSLRRNPGLLFPVSDEDVVSPIASILRPLVIKVSAMIKRESSSKREAVGKPSSLSETFDLYREFERPPLVRSYSPGFELLQQGMPADHVYLIHDGAVKLVWTEAKGKETIVGLRWRESFLGVPSVITAGPCPTSAITLVRSVVERIPAENFLDGLQTDSNLAWKIHQIQSRELEEQLTWLGELACCSARSRLANVLRRLIALNGTAGNSSTRVRLPLKQKKIAEFIGVTPEYLSRLLHGIAKECHIHLRDGWIVIPDSRALAAL